MSTLYQRGLHFFDDEGKPDKVGTRLYRELAEGSLRPLVEIVNTSPDYVILLRDDYFNVYYKGGNVAKVKSPKSVEFDKEYFRLHKNKVDEDYGEIASKRDLAKQLFKDGKFEDYFKLIIPAMENYFKLGLKGDEEKECQHQLCINNTYTSSSDYTILDLEYEVSSRSKFKYRGKDRVGKSKDSLPTPRYDIVAIRKSDGKLCIMELKKGTNALRDKAGIGEHAERFENTAGKSPETIRHFVSEMKGVLKQMQDLKLIPQEVTILSDEIEYMFVMQEKASEDTPNQFDVFDEAYRTELPKYGITKEYHVIKLKDGDYSIKG